jgi:hypothetical protein
MCHYYHYHETMAIILSIICVRGVVLVATVERTVFEGSVHTTQYTHCV